LPADVAEQRLRHALVLADLPPDEFAGALLPTMFSERMTPEAVDAFGGSMLGSTSTCSRPCGPAPAGSC
jgi:hypothetical protein